MMISLLFIAFFSLCYEFLVFYLLNEGHMGLSSFFFCSAFFRMIFGMSLQQLFYDASFMYIFKELIHWLCISTLGDPTFSAMGLETNSCPLEEKGKKQCNQILSAWWQDMPVNYLCFFCSQFGHVICILVLVWFLVW